MTATPGTTRDLVTERVSLGGIPLDLIDTAGLRTAQDEAESIGIQKSREALADADVVLLVLDATAEALSAEEISLLEQVRGRRALVVMNKIDLARANAGSELASLADGSRPAIETSALTGDGIPELRDAILALIRGEGKEVETGLMTNLRQQQAVSDTLLALGAAEQAIDANVPHEMLLIDLHSALRSLDALTGATTADDILNLIFSTFCIGK